MAIALPYNERRDRCYASFDQINVRWNQHTDQYKQLSRDSHNNQREAFHLIYEISPPSTTLFFLSTIPFKVIDLIVALAGSIIYGLTALLYCGSHSAQFKSSFKQVQHLPSEIGYLLYAAIWPSKGIDKYYDLKIAHVMA